MSKKVFYGIFILNAISSLFFLPMLPDKIPTRWDLMGEISNYSSKYLIIMFAVLPLLIYAMMQVLPKIDPKRESYSKHNKAYQTVRITTSVFMMIIYFMVLFASLGYELRVDIFVKLGIGIIFIIIGNVLSQARRNFFFGIKTPWTLSNDVVWKKTHRVGAYAFVFLGFLMIISAFITGIISVILLLMGIIIAVIFPIVYSYCEYKKVK